MVDLFSPRAFAVDREVLASPPPPPPIPQGDDYEAASDAYWRSLELVKDADGSRVRLPPPTPEKLARHVKFYGDEGVEETLRAFGQGKPDAISLRQQGASVDEIAKTLKTSVQRVRLALST